MAQTRGVFSELNDNIDKQLFAIMKDQLSELPKVYTSIFNMLSSDRKFERILSYVPFDQSVDKPEGEAYVMDLIRPGHTKDFTHTENGLGFEVTQTALEDDAENILNRAGEWLAFAARYLEEGRAANTFNNGFTSETAMDGVAVFSSAHILKGGGTARNQLSVAADLSFTSLAQAMSDSQTETVDEAGHLATPISDWILYVPPALEMLADRIVNSTQLPGSADNDRNPVKARRSWTIKVNPRLTDTDAWFIIPSSKKQHDLRFYRRVPIATEPMAVDPRTGNRIFKVRHRFSVGVGAWQGLFGSAGA